MKSNEIDESKTKYFVIAIILLVVLGVILVIHFNNKSLVSGDEDIKTTTTSTTTTVTTTTKKKRVNKNKEEVKVESDVSKSVIDETTKIVYNYKLSDEIVETDSITSEKITINEDLKNSNVIALYDISLYDINNVKKSVKNSLIEISIPLTEELLGYDEYKVVYIYDEGKIADEKFDAVVDNNYIKFSTTHLSLYGIVGIKNEKVEEVNPEVPLVKPEEETKDEVIEEVTPEINPEVTPDDKQEETIQEEIDLSKVTYDFSVNDEKIEKTNIYLSTSDKIEVKVNGINEEYKLYYLLLDEEGKNTYQEFDNKFLENIKTPSKYKLLFKIVVGEKESVPFEIGTINIYDIVYNYDKDKVVEEDIVIGEIKDEDGNESDYKDFDKNNNIVIDNVEKVEEVVPEEDISKDDIIDNETTLPEDSNIEDEIISSENVNTLPGENENNEDVSLVPGESTEDESVELPSDKVSISLKGNVYLVEKTDISNLEITGYLVIDTEEDIIFDTIDNTNIYSIIIKSKEFSINGVKYTYEVKDDKIIISKLVQVEENDEVIEKSEEISKEEFESIFDGYEYDESKEELELTPIEEVVEDSQPDNIEQPENSGEDVTERVQEQILEVNEEITTK